MPKCPNCGSYLRADDISGGKCPRCGYFLGDRIIGYGKRRGTDISGTFSIAFEIISNNFAAIFLYLIIPILIVSGISVFILWRTSSLFTSMGSTADPAQIWSSIINMMLITIPLSLISWIIQILFAGGIVGMAREGFEGRRVDIKTGLMVIKNHPLGLIGASIVLTLLISVGLVLCIVPGLIFCYWWLFTIPILIIEGKGITDAMSASKSFAKARETIGFTIAIVVVIVVLNIVGGLISSLIGGFSTSPLTTNYGTYMFSTQMIIGQVISTAVNMTVIAFTIICITVHYLRGRSIVSRFETLGFGQKPPAPPSTSTPPPPPPPPSGET